METVNRQAVHLTAHVADKAKRERLRKALLKALKAATAQK